MNYVPSLLAFPKQPLLHWETFGPVVRAAATAHPQIQARIALIGIEMAEAAVNFVPSGNGTVSRTIGCNQQQGVLVLSAAFRLVAQADVGFQGARRGTGEGGLYAQWFTSCFGPQEEGSATQRVGQTEVRPASPGCGGQEKRAPEPHGAGLLPSGSEVCEKRWFSGFKTSFRNTIPRRCAILQDRRGRVHVPSVSTLNLAKYITYAFIGNGNHLIGHDGDWIHTSNVCFVTCSCLVGTYLSAH